MDERNLYITGDLTPDRVTYIKEAKYQIDPGFAVRMVAYSEATDAPLIAFQVPHVIPAGEWAWCASVDSTARMVRALRALWFGENADKLYGQAQWLSMTVGVRVTEV